jgi:hypothetical protein
MDVFLTVKFKLHNPSRRKRALMLDVMRSAHLGYDKLLRSVEGDIRATIGLPKLFGRIKAAQEGSEEHRKRETDALKKEIRDGMLKGKKLGAEMKIIRTKLQELALPLPLGSGPKQAIQADVLAQTDSYRQLMRDDPYTGYPTASRLKVEESDWNKALSTLASSHDLLTENEMRDELARLSRPGLPRPLSVYKNRISDGALLLEDDMGRRFLYLNLLSKTSRLKKKITFEGLVDLRTGEVMKGSTSGGAIFPLESSVWHEEKFLKRGIMQSCPAPLYLCHVIRDYL